MRNNSKLKVLTLIVMIVLIVCFARSTFAASQITPIQTSTGNSPTNNSLNNIPTTSAPLNNAANNVIEAPRNNVTTNLPNTTTNTAIPQTGAKSTTVLVSLIVFALISTVYTYLKIKKYNI